MATRVIQVCGDPTVDWLSVREQAEVTQGPYFWQPDQAAEVSLGVQPGGAALIKRLLKTMIPPEQAEVQGVELAQGLLRRPIGVPVTRAWTVWRKFEGPPKLFAYRVVERSPSEPADWDYAGNRPRGPANLLVIEDSGLGFRAAADGWPEALDGPPLPEHILLKLGQYSDGRATNSRADMNPLLARLDERGLADRTTVLTSVADLRACAVRIGISLSWERLLEEIVRAVRSPACPFVAGDGPDIVFHQVIVSVGASGAVVIGRDGYALVFDRAGQEGDFQRLFPGGMVGYNTCLAAALVAAWAGGRASDDWNQAVADGVGLARLLHLHGYDVLREPAPARLQFPYETLAAAYRARRAPAGPPTGQPDDDNLKRVWDLGVFEDRGKLASDERERGAWSVLQEVVVAGAGRSQALGAARIEQVRQCAQQIAREGPDQPLQQVPIETVGDWRSADRHEIEGVRSVHNAMRDYLDGKDQHTPLAVAVFGPPGAGKSYAIKEIAKGLGIEKEAQLTFNLSQLKSPEELYRAFHQVRDLHLKGKSPVVFWDEFDTPCQGKPLGWLRYFLAPVQDGQFTEGGTVHPTGGGIYVFAGGTRSSFDAFRAEGGPDETAAKKPDFVSRLRAYIDVKGPNGDPDTVQDELYMIRRAFLLHAFLKESAPQLKRGGQFQIDDRVLNAFLRTTSYRHGARSLNALVQMSSLKGKGKFELSSLPPEHLLAMHVDVREFSSLMRWADQQTLRIGITGHMNLDKGRMKELEEGIGEAIKLIQAELPGRVLTVFSPMSIGADRLVARALLQLEGTRLIAVLPVAADDYVNDFGGTDAHHVDHEGAELRQEFRYWLAERAIEVIVMAPCPMRHDAYQKAGYFIAEHSDIMVAVWDGEGAQGTGGTGEIVAKAREKRRPICHIWAGNFKPDPKKRTDVGDKHGKIRYMNFNRDGEKANEWYGECPK